MENLIAKSKPCPLGHLFQRRWRTLEAMILKTSAAPVIPSANRAQNCANGAQPGQLMD